MKDQGTASAEAPRLFSIVAAAKQLGISRGTMFRLFGTGELGYVRVGRRRLVPADAIERFIAANTVAAKPAKAPRKGRAA